MARIKGPENNSAKKGLGEWEEISVLNRLEKNIKEKWAEKNTNEVKKLIDSLVEEATRCTPSKFLFYYFKVLFYLDKHNKKLAEYAAKKINLDFLKKIENTDLSAKSNRIESAVFLTLYFRAENLAILAKYNHK